MQWDNKNIQAFLSKAKEDLEQSGFSLLFGKGTKCNVDGLRSSGYFDIDKKKIMVASQNPSVLRILVHEIAHFYQWRGKAYWWEISCLVEKKIGNNQDWLLGKEYTQPEIDLIFMSTRNMEAECETIALGLIQEFNLPINQNEYIRMANSYIYFYNLVKKIRKWYKKPPYNFKKILNIMPDKMIVQQAEGLPKGYEELCIKYCL